MRVIAHGACPYCFAQVLVGARTTTPLVEQIIKDRIGNPSNGWCHLGVYFDVLHTRVMIIGRLEDDFPRRRQDWGQGG